MFARLTHLEFEEERYAPPFDESSVEVPDDADAEARAKLVAEAYEKHVQENGFTRLAITKAHAVGLGEFNGERVSGEILVRPGGMLVFREGTTQRITTADDAIAEARERERAEYERLGVGNAFARTGGELGMMPDVARVPSQKPPRGRRR